MLRHAQITNNVILDGLTKQVEFYAYPRPTSGYVGAGCPRSTISRNIFSFTTTQTDAERTGPTQPDGSKPQWEGGGVRAIGGFFLSAFEHPPGTCGMNTTLREVDNNVYYNPTLGVAGTAARPLFGSVGLPTMTLAAWQANTLTGIPNDKHSLVADPLFVDSRRGDFTLKANSPALGLGFEQIPPITAPSKKKAWPAD